MFFKQNKNLKIIIYNTIKMNNMNKILLYVNAEKIKRIDFQDHAKKNKHLFYVTSALNDPNAYCFD